MIPAPKSIFKSKTAFAQGLVAVAGAVGTIWPDANQLIAANASAILLVSGLLGVALRFLTKGRVVLFPPAE